MKQLFSVVCTTALLGCTLNAYAAEGNGWSFVSTGSEQTYAIKADGSLWAWGSAEYGELGNGSKSPAKVSTPTQIGTDAKWKYAAGGSGRAFFIKEDGTLWSTGTAEGGVLGTNSSIAQVLPAQIGTDTDWATVATSNGGMNYDALAIKTDGTLWGWGKNSIGCLGVGDYEIHAVPVQVGADSDWVSVSIGSDHSLMLKKDGSIWGAGNGSSRALGANLGYNKEPVKVADAADWVKIYAIEEASYAIKADGTLWAWGDNAKDMLGLELNKNGEEWVNTDEPTQVTALSGKVIDFSGSQFVRVALVGEGTTATKAYAWGYNYCGEIGNGTGVDRGDTDVTVYTTPQEVLFAEPVELSSVSCGQNFAVTLAADGTLYGWGSNAWGQLGTSEPENLLGTYKTTPIEVAAIPDEVAEGAEFDAANIPASLAGVEKIVLTGEWSTEDLKKLNAPLGNAGNFMGYTYNETLATVDMSQATFAENTSLEKIFYNCHALETVTFPSNESVENITSLNAAFLNDNKLTSVNVDDLVNVTDLDQAFQNCKSLVELNLSKWAGVEKSEMAVQNCSALTTIVLPGKFAIDDRCFGGCDELSLIDWSTFEGTEAPVFPSIDGFNPFYGTVFAPGSAAKITLIVPAAAYESFTTDSFWKEFNVKMAAAPGTYTVDADAIPASLQDAVHVILTGAWNTDKFAALAKALGTGGGLTASNGTLESLDMTAAEIAANTKLKMQVPGALFGTADKGVFQNYTALTTVLMPAGDQAANFTSFVQAFQGCTALTSIDLSGCTGLTETNDAFYNCSALTTVKFPETLVLNKEMFDRCTSLTTIDWSLYSGTTAPTYSMNALPSFIEPANPKSLTVIVPEDAYEAFLASDSWNIFTIVNSTVVGVEGVVADGALEAPRAVYDLAGRRVATLAPGESASTLPAGLYIVGGKKVLVK